MKQFLRSALLLLLCSSALAGCKSADRIMFRTPAASLSSRLPSLEVSVDPGALAATEGSLPDDPQRLFQNEIEQNIAERYDTARFGYAKLQVTSATVSRGGKAFQAVQMAFLLTPSLLGIPMEYYRTNVHAEVQIINARGETIGTYEGIGKSNVRVAMYHGYSQSAAPRLADAQALSAALNQIRPQLALAADTLRLQLLSTGPINSAVSAAAR